MKRFLILSILIIFLTVSCAGPNKVKVGWTKPDFRQDQFENDRKECIDSIYQNLNSNAFGKALEECLEKKSYEFKSVEEIEKPPEKPPSTGEIVLGVALFIVLSPLILAYGVLLVGSAP